MNYNTVYVGMMYTKKVLHFVRTQSMLKKVLTSREQKLITKMF